MSAIIKLARFIVVQQALELSEAEDEDKAELDNDSIHKSKGCLQHMQEMIDRFIVRGSYSPMQ